LFYNIFFSFPPLEATVAAGTGYSRLFGQQQNSGTELVALLCSGLWEVGKK
jgi:hypothetical protein